MAVGTRHKARPGLRSLLDDEEVVHKPPPSIGVVRMLWQDLPSLPNNQHGLRTTPRAQSSSLSCKQTVRCLWPTMRGLDTASRRTRTARAIVPEIMSKWAWRLLVQSDTCHAIQPTDDRAGNCLVIHSRGCGLPTETDWLMVVWSVWSPSLTMWFECACSSSNWGQGLCRLPSKPSLWYTVW